MPGAALGVGLACDPLSRPPRNRNPPAVTAKTSAVATTTICATRSARVYRICADNPRIPLDDLRPITPIRRPLVERRVKVPASKSVANREIVLSALAQGRSRLELGALDPGDDVWAMAAAVESLGYRVERDGGELVVQGASGRRREGGAIDAHEAGTVARFAAALAALGSGFVTITGSPRMRERPNRDRAKTRRDSSHGATSYAVFSHNKNTITFRSRMPLCA